MLPVCPHRLIKSIGKGLDKNENIKKDKNFEIEIKHLKFSIFCTTD